MTALLLDLTLLNASSIIAKAPASPNPPEPAPITGNATDKNPSFSTKAMADKTESPMDRLEALQSILMPAT